MKLRTVLLIGLWFALAGCTLHEPSTDRAPGSAAMADTAAGHAAGPLGRDETASCVESYTPGSAVRHAFAFDATVTSIDAAGTNKAGKGRLDLVAVTFTVNEWFAGRVQGSVTVDMTPPGGHSTSDEVPPSYQTGSRLLVSGEPRWGGEPFDDAIAWGCGFSRYYDAATASSWRAAATG